MKRKQKKIELVARPEYLQSDAERKIRMYRESARETSQELLREHSGLEAESPFKIGARKGVAQSVKPTPPPRPPPLIQRMVQQHDFLPAAAGSGEGSSTSRKPSFFQKWFKTAGGSEGGTQQTHGSSGASPPAGRASRGSSQVLTFSVVGYVECVGTYK